MPDEASRQFEPELQSVGDARRFAVEVAGRWGVAEGDIALVVGELAANAVRHGHTPFTVCLRRDQRVAIEVSDLGATVVQGRPGAMEDQSGRGLQIVDRLASDWGIRPFPTGGKLVWATLDR
jgi:anti-sigma regulatory factor (Ser/Thr protein kinase)